MTAARSGGRCGGRTLRRIGGDWQSGTSPLANPIANPIANPLANPPFGLKR
jgi:hypothetical protein